MRGLQGKEYLDSILDEQEQTYIQHFVANEGMFNAVRKALLAGLYEQGTLKKGNKKPDSLTNVAFGLLFQGVKLTKQELGENLSALWEGLNWVEMSLENLAKYKVIEKGREDKKNPAR